MWSFCVRSLVREYGWRFAFRVALPHPLSTLDALRDAAALESRAGAVDVGGPPGAGPFVGPPSIVGAGFCLKPIEPQCPSGRGNHDCWFFEHASGSDGTAAPLPCRTCALREVGAKALRSGAAFYVMTSARDILDDVFVPALESRRFPTGLFVLCRYSFRPFAAGVLASGMSARMLPLGSGDCRTYREWLLADRGIKPEQTTVDAAERPALAEALPDAAATAAERFEKRGNVFYPVATGSAA